MGVRIRLLVLKRIRAGDSDLLAKAYGPGGILNILVRDGFEPSCPMVGIFEPFNLVQADVVQKGDVLVPRDVIKVQHLSHLSKDYERFVWMSWVCGFILRTVLFYDEKLFRLFLGYLLKEEITRRDLLRVKFKLDFLILSGFKPLFLESDVRKRTVHIKLEDGSLGEEGIAVRGKAVRALKVLEGTEDLQRVKLDRDTIREMESLIDRLIDFHMNR